jgi:hypothetical protein
MPVPLGVRAAAALFALGGIYLGIVAGFMLASRGSVPMAAGAPLLFGLELSGPYMFLLTALVGMVVAWGLVKRSNIARHAAMLIAIAGVVMLVPSVSSAAAMVEPAPLIRGGLGIIVRVIVAWVLGRRETVEAFRRVS